MLGRDSRYSKATSTNMRACPFYAGASLEPYGIGTAWHLRVGDLTVDLFRLRLMLDGRLGTKGMNNPRDNDFLKHYRIGPHALLTS
jgi:hypothetical protein